MAGPTDPIGGGATWSIRDRLAELFRRLDEAAAPASAEDAFAQLAEILTAVEDQYSGVVRRADPPLAWDGRMYPPREDHIVRNPDGSITAHTRGHLVQIGTDGSLQITESDTHAVVYTRRDGDEMAVTDLARLKEAVLAQRPQATVTVNVFPSGAILIRVSELGRTTTLERSSDGSEWGVSPAVGPDEIFVSGHPHVYPTYEEAVGHLFDIVAGSGRPE